MTTDTLLAHQVGTAARTRAAVRGEFTKARSGWLLLTLILCGAGLATLSTSGAVAAYQDQPPADVPAATAEVARFAFMMVLTSSLFGLLFVTREFQTGVIARSALLSGSRVTTFWSKALITLGVGVIFGLVAVGVGLASSWFMMPAVDVTPAWSEELTHTLLGVFFVVTLGALWGQMLGWIIRQQVVGIAVLFLLTLVVDETLFRLLPAVGRFTMQIAMGSIYQDGKPEALEVPAAIAVTLAWVVLAAVIGYRLLKKRPLL